MNASIGRRVGLLAAIAAALAVLAMMTASTWALPSRSSLQHGPTPPVTPQPVPSPTPVVLGNPAHLAVEPTGYTGEVTARWEPAQNATVHWVWSAKWDGTGGKWTPSARNQVVVSGLEHWEDHWFTVIAGIDRGSGLYEWSKWSNWARGSPEWHPNPTADADAGIGDIDVQKAFGPDSTLAFAMTPCDGPTASTVPAQHGGGSPTGSPCARGAEINFNLTPLVSSGHKFKIQMACIDRNSDDCALASGAYGAYTDIGFVERVRQRTRGQVQFEVTTFSELGVAPADSLRLLKDGTLQAAQIHPSHVKISHPIADITNLWGLYPDQATNLSVVDAVQPAMADLTAAQGGVQVAYMVTDHHYLFSRRDVHRDPDTWLGFRVGADSADLRRMLSGMGVEARSLRYRDPRGALKGGLVDGAIFCAWCGDRLQLYEVTDYIMGPFYNIPHSWLAVNTEIWKKMPRDLQNIIQEEGARHAYVNRSLVLLASEPEAVGHSTGKEVRYAPFSDAVVNHMRQSAIENVVPAWVERTGGPDSDAVRLFNQVVGPIINLSINPDGSVSEAH